MQRTNQGLQAVHVLRVGWRKSRYSNPCGSCVEIGQLACGGVAVRNSRHPGGTVLVYSRAEVAEFLHGLKTGEFDRVMGASVD